MADQEPKMSNKIAGYELTAAGEAGSTFVSNYFMPFFGHSKPFPVIQRNVQSIKYIM
jgi:hypothetical protein